MADPHQCLKQSNKKHDILQTTITVITTINNIKVVSNLFKLATYFDCLKYPQPGERQHTPETSAED